MGSILGMNICCEEGEEEEMILRYWGKDQMDRGGLRRERFK